MDYGHEGGRFCRRIREEVSINRNRLRFSAHAGFCNPLSRTADSRDHFEVPA
jgi:hypothetical protein